MRYRQKAAKRAAGGGLARRIRAWLMLCSIMLLVLILARLGGLQVFVEIEYDGEPLRTALTDIETYYLPLALVLAVFILAWAWKHLIGRRKS